MTRRLGAAIVVRVVVPILLVAPGAAAGAPGGDGASAPEGVGGGVAVNGVAIPDARTRLDITVDIAEFREGGNPVALLLQGHKHYVLTVRAPSPVALFDAELPAGPAPNRFSVRVEDGREFTRCLVAGLATRDRPRPFVYALQCENVGVPGQ
jgi:hypothetical protein